jgi:hypothetical protein
MNQTNEVCNGTLQEYDGREIYLIRILPYGEGLLVNRRLD